MSADPTLLSDIRAKVKQALTRSAAFNAMPPAERAELAHNTVRAFHYILGGADGQTRPGAVTLAGNSAGFTPGEVQAQAQTVSEAMRTPPPRAGAATPIKLAPKPGLGGAARAGGDAMADLVPEVDFPVFVGGLIDGVFNSIVTSSIKQMEAYAELVKNVSKTVDQYMKDNVSEQNGRDYLVQRYPEHLEMDFSGEAPQVKPREGIDESNLPDFFADLGLSSPMTGLDADSVEQQLVPAARQRIAMDRQQLLATMVMMGVNRLVVTNGSIEASCLFKLDTHDLRTRGRTSTAGTTGGHSSSDRSGYGGDANWNFENQKNKYSGSANWYNNQSRSEHVNFSVSTVDTNKSEEEIKLHAELSGKLKLNFKSDYFPMERMVDALQINQIREKAPAAAPPAAALPPPPPLPPMPAMPSIPGVTAPAAPTR